MVDPFLRAIGTPGNRNQTAMTKSATAQQKAEQRAKRLGDALKANLKKRRAQLRARDGSPNDAIGAEPDREDSFGGDAEGPPDRD